MVSARKGTGKVGRLYIQYVGFDNAVRSRTYAFHVIDSPVETREFTVKVQAAAFGAGSLKLQDGPGICFDRLQRELEMETQELRAEALLHIGETDIQEYRARHYPRKKTFERYGNGARPLA
jgi:hypothetical protein